MEVFEKGPAEHCEQEISRIQSRLESIGYAGEALAGAVSRLRSVISKYDNADTAARLLADGFSNYVSSPFGDRQFWAFLREIDPDILGIDGDLIEEEVGKKFDVESPFDIEYGMEREEKEAYFKELNEAKNRLRNKRASMYDFLSRKETYDILNSVTWKKIPEGYPLPENKLLRHKPISTPMGGMPWYRKKFRRK